MRRHLYVAAASLAVARAAFGCAAGEVAEQDTTYDASGDDPIDATSSPDARRDASSPAFDAAQFDAALADSAPTTDGPASCAPTNTCQTPSDMGSVSGDTTSTPKSGNSFASKWFLVDVAENDNSVVGRKLKMTATLTSPVGTNFDLYLYANAGGSPTGRECTSLSTQSTNGSGQVDTASITWGEGTVANGNDDSRIVSVEVRYVAGACGPSSKWELVVSGN